MKKAQASFEFLLIFLILTIFIAAFAAIIFFNTSQGRVKDEQEIVDDMANFLQQELILASKVENGYNRSFLLPEKINGKDYSTTISDYSLIVSTNKVGSLKGIPKVRGNFIVNEYNIILKNETSPYIFINIHP